MKPLFLSAIAMWIALLSGCAAQESGADSRFSLFSISAPPPGGQIITVDPDPFAFTIRIDHNDPKPPYFKVEGSSIAAWYGDGMTPIKFRDTAVADLIRSLNCEQLWTKTENNAWIQVEVPSDAFTLKAGFKQVVIDAVIVVAKAPVAAHLKLTIKEAPK